MRTIKFYSILSALFLLSSVASAQIPNGGFENWNTDVDGNINPNSWETTNDIGSGFTSVTQYTPAYVGSYSMLVKSWNSGFGIIGGVSSTSFPYNQKPTYLKACIKTNVMPGDNVYIIVALYKADSIISSSANCTFVIDSTINNFRCINFPISYQYNLIPDSVEIMVIGGSAIAQLGTQIIVDDLSFGFTSGINELSLTSTNENLNVYPNPAQNNLFFETQISKISDIKIKIYDFNGSLLSENFFSNVDFGSHEFDVSISNLSNGMYFYSVENDNSTKNGKFVISK
jgi:hypothetical protein